MIFKRVARLVGLAHVRMAGDFKWAKICRFSFVLSRPRKHIYPCRREGSAAKRAHAQSHLHASSFPLWVGSPGPSPYLPWLLPTRLQTTNDRKEQTVNVSGGRVINPVSPTASVKEPMTHSWIHFPLGVTSEGKVRMTGENGGVGKQQSQGHIQE